MSCKVYIGNIPANLSEESLQIYFKRFSPLGEFSLVRTAKESSPKGGFGFLKLTDEHQVKLVLAEEHMIEGYLIKCEQYLGNEEPQPIKNSLRRRRLFIRNLKKSITDSELLEHFSKFGEVESAYSVKAHASHKARSFGYVTFKIEEPALLLIKAGKLLIKGVEISIHPFRKIAETASELNSAPELANQNAAMAPGPNLIRQEFKSELQEADLSKVDASVDMKLSSTPALARWFSSRDHSSNSEEASEPNQIGSYLLQRSSRASEKASSHEKNLSDPVNRDPQLNHGYKLFRGHTLARPNLLTSSNQSLEEKPPNPEAPSLQKARKELQLRTTSPDHLWTHIHSQFRTNSYRIHSQKYPGLSSRPGIDFDSIELVHSSKPTNSIYFHRQRALLNHHSSNIELNIISTPRLELPAARSLEIPFQTRNQNNNSNSFPLTF
jgi:RNA recognition motif-containing protein